MISSSLRLAGLGLLVLAPRAPQEPDPKVPPPAPETQVEAPEPEVEAPPPVRFRARKLETLRSPPCALGAQVMAINAGGAIVGSVCRGESSRAAYWSPEGRLTLVDSRESGPDSFAHDINDEGVVVGYSVQGLTREAFRWTAEGGRVSLDLEPRAVPLAINASGAIAFSFPLDREVRAAVWSQDEGLEAIDWTDGDLLVRGINAAGVVTGIAGGGARPARAFRWSPTTGLRELGLPAGFAHAHGNAIDAEGVVVGSSRGDAREQATRWDPEGAPTLLPCVAEESTHSVAHALNAAGWVVGAEYAGSSGLERSRGVLWIEGRPFVLDRLLIQAERGGTVHVSLARDVNDGGQIAALGSLNGERCVLRLDPE